MLLKDSLMTLVTLELLVWVIVISLGVCLPDVVFVQLLQPLSFDLVHLALGVLLKLVAERHKQVSLPDVELSLKGIGFAYGCEE